MRVKHKNNFLLSKVRRSLPEPVTFETKKGSGGKRAPNPHGQLSTGYLLDVPQKQQPCHEPN